VSGISRCRLCSVNLLGLDTSIVSEAEQLVEGDRLAATRAQPTEPESVHEDRAVLAALLAEQLDPTLRALVDGRRLALALGR